MQACRVHLHGDWGSRVHKPRRVPHCFAASGPLTAIRVSALLRIASRSCLLASLVHLSAGMQACRVHLHGDWGSRVHKPRRVPRCFAASGPLTAIRVSALLRIASRSCLLASLVHLSAGMQACRVHLHGDWAYARMLQICYGNVDKRNKHIYNVRCIDKYDGADRIRWLNMSAAVVLMNVHAMERR
jgi:hypothetical protein